MNTNYNITDVNMSDDKDAYFRENFKDSVADFDTNSSDWVYLGYPSNNDGATDTVTSSTNHNTDNTIKLVLISLIFGISLIGNSSLIFVVNMTIKKTVIQKLLMSTLSITCIIRASVNFIKYVYVTAYQNQWKFNVVICKADAFLDNFSTAAFPYVLLFLVFDSTKVILCYHGNRGSRYNQNNKCCSLVSVIVTFMGVLILPIAFAILLTVMTTTKVISAYGQGTAVPNATLCFLDINTFSHFTPFKTYITFHAAVWLICVPFLIIAIMYTCISVVACWKRCTCMRTSHYENNNQIILEERNSLAKNWFLTVIILTIVYVVCFPPYEVLKLLYQYLEVPYSNIEIMIVYFLFYAPPAFIPLVFCIVDHVIRQAYFKYLFCSFKCTKSHYIARHIDDITSQRSNSICSSTIYAKSDVTAPDSRTTCTNVSIGSRSEYVDYGQDEEKAHIIPPSPSLSYCSSHDDWTGSNGHNRIKAKVKKIKDSDNEEDVTPILVTSL